MLIAVEVLLVEQGCFPMCRVREKLFWECMDDVRLHSFTSRRRQNSTFPIKLICIRVFIEYFRLSFQIVNDCFMSYASA